MDQVEARVRFRAASPIPEDVQAGRPTYNDVNPALQANLNARTALRVRPRSAGLNFDEGRRCPFNHLCYSRPPPVTKKDKERQINHWTSTSARLKQRPNDSPDALKLPPADAPIRIALLCLPRVGTTMGKKAPIWQVNSSKNPDPDGPIQARKNRRNHT